MENPERTYTWRVIQDGRIWLLQMLPEHWINAEPCPDCGAPAGVPCAEDCEAQQWPHLPATVSVNDLEER
jgi:hypothetical protein